MKNKRLLKLLESCAILLVLVVVMPFIGACTGPAGSAGSAGPAGLAGPAGKAGKAGPPGSPGAPAALSGVSFKVVPPVEVISKKNSITFLGAGLKPGQEIHIFILNEARPVSPLRTEITFAFDPVPEVNENGSFTATMSGREFSKRLPGLYTIALVGRDGKLLATAPLKLVKEKK